jgi:hypothetical protein
MKGGILAFIGGLAAAIGIGALNAKRLATRVAAGLTTLDLNNAPAEAFAALGVTSEAADRIIDNRPYRSKLELIERFVIPRADYDLIKSRISIDQSHANDAVKVAS